MTKHLDPTLRNGMAVPVFEYGDALTCPGCGSVNLHHYHVTAYNRAEDDETKSVGSGALSEDEPVQLENPSRRRDAVGVRFTCECCPGRFELCVIQHKGTTYLNWRTVV